MRTTRSLRSNLALTYAGIALLTAVLLGGILLSVLAGYYARAEDAYLRAAAQRVQAATPRVAEAGSLASWAQLAALSAQTRVQLFDADGEIIADSGSPRDLDPGAFLPPEARERRDRDEDDPLPEPLGRGIFGDAGAATERGGRAMTLAVSGLAGVSAITLSEAPASGRDALVSVAQAWTLAALLAVALAALAGYLVSSRISRPIVALTEASDAMADGDLSARASVTREDELGHLAVSFNEMAGRVEATVVALRRFVGDAAHEEIGTPLTALQADLELAEQAAVGEDEKRLVTRALGQARRLEALSANLLRLSRIEAGDSPGTVQLLDVTAVARESAETVASRAEASGVELRLDIAPGPLVVAADRAELLAVLGNLLDNAIKFTPEDGSVTLTAVPGDGTVRMTVADTGVGIPEAEQTEVFSRFHRARNVAAYPGSGLGLAITKAAVDRMGGSVDFSSSEAGSTFIVTLPLAAGEPTASAQ